MGILDKIIERAKADKKKIVLPEAIYEARTIKAGVILQRDGIADVIFLGDKAKIESMVSESGISIEGIEVLDHEKSDLLGMRSLSEYKYLYLDDRQAHQGLIEKCFKEVATGRE